MCVVLGPKKSSAYSSEYASGFSGPAALHLAAPPSFRHEGNVGRLLTITHDRRCEIKTGKAFCLLQNLAVHPLDTDFQIAGVINIQVHHRPMSPNG
jgi:hypothetical protein